MVAVSPMVSGPAFAARGSAEKSVAILGIRPEEYLRIVPVQENMEVGEMVAFTGAPRAPAKAPS